MKCAYMLKWSINTKITENTSNRGNPSMKSIIASSHTLSRVLRVVVTLLSSWLCTYAFDIHRIWLPSSQHRDSFLPNIALLIVDCMSSELQSALLSYWHVVVWEYTPRSEVTQTSHGTLNILPLDIAWVTVGSFNSSSLIFLNSSSCLFLIPYYAFVGDHHRKKPSLFFNLFGNLAKLW